MASPSGNNGGVVSSLPPPPAPSPPGCRPPGVREVGSLASWAVTTAKPGNGVDALRDGSASTYWQSDGLQPHLIDVQFSQRMELTEIAFFLDYRADESYTPSRLAVRAGCSHHDLRDVSIVELKEPVGWLSVPLTSGGADAAPICASLLQVAVLSNHQNGRDTHMRQVLVYGRPRGSGTAAAATGPCIPRLPAITAVSGRPGGQVPAAWSAWAGIR